MNERSFHEIDCRLREIELWKHGMVNLDMPSIRETIEKEIPAHYTSKIEKAKLEIETTTDLKIQNAIHSTVIRILLGAGGLLAIQSVIEKILGI